MNILDAARRMARKYPGGVEALALRLDKAPSTLEKEVRGAPGFKLGADDAHEMSKMCHEVGMVDPLAFLTTWAAGMDCLVIPMPPTVGVDGAECMKAVAAAASEASEMIAEACAALADGKVTDNEMRAIDGAIGEMVSSAQALRRTMAAINEAGKPRQD